MLLHLLSTSLTSKWRKWKMQVFDTNLSSSIVLNYFCEIWWNVFFWEKIVFRRFFSIGTILSWKFNRNVNKMFCLGLGNNVKNINIDDRKWLTWTTFLTPRNINIEKVRQHCSSFFFFGGGAWPDLDVIISGILKLKKNRKKVEFK